MSTYLFRFHKGAGWGIWIQITAEYAPLTQYRFQGTGDDHFRKITDRLFFEVSWTSMHWDEDIEYLVFGLGLIADQIEALYPETLVIRVMDIVYPVTDYQEEGMVYAIVGWAVQEFGLTYTLPPIVFDKQLNRYLFNF